MKTIRWSISFLLATTLLPMVSYARPIPVVSHSRTNIVHDRSPRIQSHESMVHHS